MKHGVPDCSAFAAQLNPRSGSFALTLATYCHDGTGQFHWSPALAELLFCSRTGCDWVSRLEVKPFQGANATRALSIQPRICAAVGRKRIISGSPAAVPRHLLLMEATSFPSESLWVGTERQVRVNRSSTPRCWSLGFIQLTTPSRPTQHQTVDHRRLQRGQVLHDALNTPPAASRRRRGYRQAGTRTRRRRSGRTKITAKAAANGCFQRKHRSQNAAFEPHRARSHNSLDLGYCLGVALKKPRLAGIGASRHGTSVYRLSATTRGTGSQEAYLVPSNLTG